MVSVDMDIYITNNKSKKAYVLDDVFIKLKEGSPNRKWIHPSDVYTITSIAPDGTVILSGKYRINVNEIEKFSKYKRKKVDPL
jgi:hypothetical protein